MINLIKTDIGLVDISDVINVTVGDYETPFEITPTICLHKKGKFWNKKKYIHFAREEKRNKIYNQIMEKIID